MDISSLTIRLLFLFLPGIVTLFIIDHLTVHQKIDSWKYFLYSIILGFINYLVWYLLYHIPFLSIGTFYFFEALLNENALLNINEIIFVMIISFVSGIALTYLINYKIIFKLLRKIKITSKSGAIDVWNYIFDTEETKFVAIRDYDRDLMFVGTVLLFSNTTPDKEELFLHDVKVYCNSTAELIYEVPAMYISTTKGKMEIEFPYLDSENTTNMNNDEE